MGWGGMGWGGMGWGDSPDRVDSDILSRVHSGLGCVNANNFRSAHTVARPYLVEEGALFEGGTPTKDGLDIGEGSGNIQATAHRTD